MGKTGVARDWLEHNAPLQTPVETMIWDEKGARNLAVLIKDKGLWWTPDMSMYVYYKPTHWRYL